jgi:hypothetical protein
MILYYLLIVLMPSVNLNLLFIVLLFSTIGSRSNAHYLREP